MLHCGVLRAIPASAGFVASDSLKQLKHAVLLGRRWYEKDCRYLLDAEQATVAGRCC
jgi:hypothetical protein